MRPKLRRFLTPLRWDWLPLNIPAFSGRTRVQKLRRGRIPGQFSADRQDINLHNLNPDGAASKLPPWTLLLVSGWVNRQHQAVIDYLLDENRIRRTAHAPRRLRLTDDRGAASP